MESVKTYGDWIRNEVLWLNVDFRNNLPLMNWNAACSLSPPPPPPPWQRSGCKRSFCNRSAFKSSARRSELETRRCGSAPFSGVKAFGSHCLLAPKALEASLAHILSSTWRRLESSSPPWTRLSKRLAYSLVPGPVPACVHACMRASWSRGCAAKVG